MMLPQPPVVIFVQDDANRPQVVSVQKGKSSPEKAWAVGQKRDNSPPKSRSGDLPTQNADEDCQFVPPYPSHIKNKPQRKTSFRLTR